MIILIVVIVLQAYMGRNKDEGFSFEEDEKKAQAEPEKAPEPEAPTEPESPPEPDSPPDDVGTE